MNIYEPYTEADKGDALLHLKQSFKNRVEGIILSRLVPLLVLIVVFLIYVVHDASFLEWITGILLFVSLTVLVVLNIKTGTDIYFKEGAIEMDTDRIYGRKKETILLRDADFVDLEIYNDPRVSGAYYRLVLKNKRRILLLRISGFLKPDEDRFRQLNQTLEHITRLQIQNTWKGL